MPSVFLAELTNNEVEEYLQAHDLILVPTGSTEQHGPHAPLGTDVIIPTEVCRRVAVQRGCLVAPAVPYGLSSGHRGFKGLAYLNPPAFLAVIEDIAFSLAESGFRHIVFVNGHYTNEPAINLACLNVHPRLPVGTKAWAVSYWNAMPADERDAYLSLETGLHANIGETSCVMAVRPDLVHLERAVAEWPDFSGLQAPVMPVIYAYFETRPGSVYQAFRQGTWGDPADSTAERGDVYYEQAARAVSQLIDDVDLTYRRINVRG
jgi:creatinine amidohydrolase